MTVVAEDGRAEKIVIVEHPLAGSVTVLVSFLGLEENQRELT